MKGFYRWAVMAVCACLLALPATAAPYKSEYKLSVVPGATQIDALVPLSEMFGYATDLRSSTQGRGQYTMEPHSYVEIPKSIAEKIIAERGRKDD